MRSLPGRQGTPLIAISANAFDEDRQASKAAGMNDFLAKPIEVGLLYEKLLYWLDQGVAAPPTPAPAPVRPSAPRGPDPALAPLLGLEGIDAEGGLAAVGGRVELYRRLLGVFGQTHGGDGRAVQQLLAGGDAAAVAALAHRVRGSAATLGLVDVETAAAELEHALDAGLAPADAVALGDAFVAALDGTVQRLHLALGL
jgi:HPt (histidine-containing phosphotransfer) domain-containing protein